MGMGGRERGSERDTGRYGREGGKKRWDGIGEREG